MSPLSLDYQRARPRLGIFEIIILLVAIVLGIQIMLSYRQVEQQLMLREAKLEQLQKNTTRRSSTKQPISGEASESLRQETKRANEVVTHLATPWNALFEAIESSRYENVALLSLQPDEKNNGINITGEAKDLSAMLDFMRRLESEKIFSSVTLVSHQTELQDPEKPVKFSILAWWPIKS